MNVAGNDRRLDPKEMSRKSLLGTLEGVERLEVPHVADVLADVAVRWPSRGRTSPSARRPRPARGPVPVAKAGNGKGA